MDYNSGDSNYKNECSVIVTLLNSQGVTRSLLIIPADSSETTDDKHKQSEGARPDSSPNQKKQLYSEMLSRKPGAAKVQASLADLWHCLGDKGMQIELRGGEKSSEEVSWRYQLLFFIKTRTLL